MPTASLLLVTATGLVLFCPERDVLFPSTATTIINNYLDNAFRPRNSCDGHIQRRHHFTQSFAYVLPNSVALLILNTLNQPHFKAATILPKGGRPNHKHLII